MARARYGLQGKRRAAVKIGAMPTNAPPDQEQSRERLKSDLSVPQIFGSALAAISASFAASYLGIVGTFIGAAVVSVVATVGTALYRHSLERTKSALHEAVSRTDLREMAARAALLNRPLRRVEPRTLAEQASTVSAEPEATPASPRRTRPRAELLGMRAEFHSMASSAHVLARSADATRVEGTDPARHVVQSTSDRRWKMRTAFATLAVLLVTLAGVTGLELLAGKPLSAWLRDDAQRSGTSVGDVLRTKQRPAKEHEPAPTSTPSQPGTVTAPPIPQPGPGQSPAPSTSPVPPPPVTTAPPSSDSPTPSTPVPSPSLSITPTG